LAGFLRFFASGTAGTRQVEASQSQSQIRGALNEMAEQGTISVTGEKRAKHYKAV